MSNNNISLLNKKISERSNLNSYKNYKVYIEDKEGNIFSTKISPEAVSVIEAIQESIKNFNIQYNADLANQPEKYQLHLAKKNGRKNNDLPSLEKGQVLDKIGSEKFYLTTPNQEIRPLASNSTSTLKSISLKFQIDQKQMKEEIPEQKSFFGCFCSRK